MKLIQNVEPFSRQAAIQPMGEEILTMNRHSKKEAKNDLFNHRRPAVNVR